MALTPMPEHKSGGNKVAMLVIGGIAVVLVAGLVGVIALRSSGESSSGASTQIAESSPPTSSRSASPESTTAGRVATSTDSPRQVRLSSIDLSQADAPAALEQLAGSLMRPCSGTGALTGVPHLSLGRSLQLDAISATSITGEFDTAAAASTWFNAVTAIKEGCTFDHGNNFTEKIKAVKTEALAGGAKIVRVTWQVDDGSGSLIIGEDDYLLRDTLVGSVNCQADEASFNAAECRKLLDAYLKRFTTVR